MIPNLWMENCTRGFFCQEMDSVLNYNTARARESAAIDALTLSATTNRALGIQLSKWKPTNIRKVGANQLNNGKERLKLDIRLGCAKEIRLPDVKNMPNYE